MDIKSNGKECVARVSATNIKPDQDVTLEMHEIPGYIGATPRGEALGPPRVAAADQAQFSSHIHEGHQYLMLRYQPDLVTSQPKQQRRDWVFLFETSANRDPLLARTQIEIVRTLLENAGHDDTFSILTAGTRVRHFDDKARPVTAANIDHAIKFLDKAHLIGALDLDQALRSTLPILERAKDPHLVHVGAGVAAMGEKREDVLARLIPDRVHYVGIGIGKVWSRAFMKIAAERTAGYFTQINPDEPVAWRAFELLATLNTPRLLELQVGLPSSALNRKPFLTEALSLAQGEELCAIARLGKDDALPGTIVVSGKVDGVPFSKEIAVENVTKDAGYLPRQWAKLEIDRLLAEDGTKNKQAIIDLSKASYVMSPYTSLLVLETEADYVRFKVDRGRKDHWALYVCPDKIPTVHEPDERWKAVVSPAPSKEQRDRQEVLKTVLVRTTPQLVADGCVLPVVPIAAGTTLKLSTEDQRTQRFWNEYYDAMTRPDRIDWVAYYKNHGYQINAGPFPPGGFGFGGGLNSTDGGQRSGSGSTGNVGTSMAIGSGNISAFSNGSYGLSSLHNGMKNNPMYSYVPNPSDPFSTFYISPASHGIVGTSTSANTFGSPQFAMSQPTYTTTQMQFAPVVAPPANSMVPSSLPAPQTIATATTMTQPVSPMPQITSPVPAPVTAIPMSPMPVPVTSIPVVPMPQPMNPMLPDFNPVSPNPSMQPMNVVLPTLTATANTIGPQYMTQVPPTPPPAVYAMPKTGNPFGGYGPYGMSGGPVYDVSGVLMVAPPTRSVFVDGSSNQERLRAGLFDRSDCCDPCGTDLGIATSPTALVYKRPTLNIDPRLFSGLTLYAPALNTSDADIQALLEAEAAPAQPVLIGPIDPAARALIDKARSLGWSSLAVGDVKLFVNGAGEFAFENTLSSGLKQQVYCDGKMLLHLYPEIGLGARRTMSRFHRAELAAAVPWLVVPAEDLARGAELKVIDERTVAIVSLEDAKPQAAVHLVFATDGALMERRLVELPSGKVVHRQTIVGQAAQSDRPYLSPDLSKLVVVPMPLRTREHLHAQNKKAVETGSFDGLDADLATGLIAAECLQHGGDKALQIFGERFHAKGDRRLGFYVLLIAGQNWAVNSHPGIGGGIGYPPPGYHVAPYTYYQSYIVTANPIEFDEPYRWGKVETKFNIEAEHPNNPLASYLSHVNKLLKDRSNPIVGKLPGTGAGSIAQLAEFHDLCLDRAGEKQRERALTFIKKTCSPLQAWIVLDRLERSVSQLEPGLREEIHKTALLTQNRFGALSGLSYVLRYETAWTAEHFREVYAETLAAGMLPPIDLRFVKMLKNVPGENGLAALSRQTVSSLLKRQDRRTGILFAWQLWQLDEKVLAGQVLATVLESDAGNKDLMLSAIDYLYRTGQWAAAADLLQKLLAQDDCARQPVLWRLAAGLASKRNAPRERIVACLEKVIELEQTSGDSVDLKQFREDHSALLKEYQKLTGEPSADLLAKVVRAADRWRSLDPDVTQVCQQSAGCLQALGARELAWDYLTTPIGLKPNEAAPWLSLATKLCGESQLALGDRAYAAAYQTEPTNAQILWDRAGNLVKLGQPDRARQLIRQIAEGTWQPRFQELQRRAAEQLSR
jgi:tetratricopeptide (TPR) repeat protein